MKTTQYTPVKTQGNFVTVGKDGERIAAFACQADQKLFAAAPALLEALEAMMHEVAMIDGDEAWDKETACLVEARAALKQAKGE